MTKVMGNWEYWEEINDYINLIGLDDSEGNPDLAITKKLPANKLNIALFHTPSLI